MKKMKRTLLILVLALTATLNVLSQTATAPAVGDGSAGNPYQIATLNNLFWIAAPDSVVPSPSRVTRWSSHYLQISNIDATETSEWFDSQGWIPIELINGSYNGQLYSINNLYINRPGEVVTGFIYFVSHSIITNIELNNIYSKSNKYAGGIAGIIIQSDIQNCKVNGNLEAVSDGISEMRCGLIASTIDGSNLTNCSSSGNITCISHDTVAILIGGFCGEIGGCTVINCLSDVNITIESENYNDELFVGGFVGSSGGATLSNNYSKGEISIHLNNGFGYIGGFAGDCDETIVLNCCSDCSAYTKIDTGIVNIAGFVGYSMSSQFESCLSKSIANAVGDSVQSDGFVAYPMGWQFFNCYWISSFNSNSSRGTGLTLTQMRNPDSLVGFDFVNNWKMSEDRSDYCGLPILIWMDNPEHGEITLKGNDQAIASGDATPSVADFTDFGEAVANNETISRTFEIANTAAADLNLNGTSPYVNLSGAEASQFSIINFPSSVITQNGNTTFRVAFSPTGAVTGTRSATVTIASNDADESIYTFDVQGTGVSAPTIQAQNISFSNISRTGMTASWTRGNGDKCVLLGRETYTIPSAPLTDGLSYSNASASYTDQLNTNVSGAKVLYNGNAANPSVSITNLTKYKLYYFKVAEYNEVRENEDKITLYQQAVTNKNPISRWTLRKEGEDSETNSEFLYPNPATNEINYNAYIPETSDVRLEIYSTDSKLIKNINFGRYPEGNAKLTADISELIGGTYLIVYHIGEASFVSLIDVVK